MSASNEFAAMPLRRLIVGYRISQALFVAAKLGIADQLSEGPKNVDDLARATGAHALSLYRVLRLLASEGVFAEESRGRFKLTPLAMPLQSGVSGSLSSRALFDGDACNWRAWGNLLHSVTTGAPAFEHTFGVGLFDYLSEHTAVAASFDALMATQTTPWAHAVLDAYDFSGIDTLVDVGGGYGALLAAILTARPAMRGVLYDLPHVIAGAESSLTAAGIADRCGVVAGDFFESVPKGGDGYLLKYILHDWDDSRCETILRNCRDAMTPDGRLLVVEMLIVPGNEPDYAKFLDLNMLVLTGGRERSEEEYRRLFETAGFTLSRIVATPSELSIMEAVPV